MAHSVPDEAESWITPAARPGGAVAAPVPEVLRQPARFDQPVQHVLFQLGDRRGGGPQHALHAQPGRDQLGQHRRRAGVGGEVPEEAGRLPVGERRDDHPVQVGDGTGQVAPVFGRVGVELVPHPPGLHRRADRQVVGATPVVGHPVDQLMAVGAERRLGQLRRSRRASPLRPVSRCATASIVSRIVPRRSSPQGSGMIDRLVDAGGLVGIDRRGDGRRRRRRCRWRRSFVAHRGLAAPRSPCLVCGADRGDLVGEPGTPKRLGVGGHDGVAKQVAWPCVPGGCRGSHTPTCT
jgi:hypothetical protein